MTTVTTVALGAPAKDRLMAALAQRIEAAGIEVRLIEMNPAETDEVNQRRLHSLVGAAEPCVIGGFSLGARIAAQLCSTLTPAGLLCFGYPFHDRRNAQADDGLAALSRVRVTTRIVQGTRDSHGNLEQVRGYRLRECIEVVWLHDGNHRFVPRPASGVSHARHLEAAAAAGISFIRSR